MEELPPLAAGMAYVPMAVMLGAVAALALGTGALPVWLGWLSAAAAVVHLTGWFGVLASGGPLAPGGWFTYLPYALMLAWLVSVTTVMVRRLARTDSHY